VITSAEEKKEEKKEEVVPTAEDIVHYSGLKDTTVSKKDCGSVSSAQPQSYQQPSPVFPKPLFDEQKSPVAKKQSSKSQASTKLPVQVPKHNDRPAPSLQEILDQPTTRAAPTESQLPSRPEAVNRDENIQTFGPNFKEEEKAPRKHFTEQIKVNEQRFRQWEQKLIAERDRLNKDLEASHAVIKRLEGEVNNLQAPPQTPKPTIRDQGTQKHKPATRDQDTQTPSTWATTRDQVTPTEASTDAPIQELKLRDKPALPLRGILKKSSNTPSSTTEPRTQEKTSENARLELLLPGMLKWLSEERMGPEQATQSAKPDLPRPAQQDPVPPSTLQPSQTRLT